MRSHPSGVTQLFTVGKDGALFVWNWVPYADGEGPQIEAEGIVLWLIESGRWTIFS